MEMPEYNKHVKVRLATNDDIPEAERIAVKAFNANLLGAYKPDTTLVVEGPEGNIVAAMIITPDPMWWGTASIPAAAVGGVATDPTQQKKGYAGAMMIGAVHHYREHGWAVSPLWPFSFAYYRKFGWELPQRDWVIRAWPDMLRGLPGSASGVRTANKDDLEGLVSTYSRAAQRTNAQTNRSQTNWDNRVREESSGERSFFDQCLIHTDKKGSVDGYALYGMHSRDRSQGQDMTVRELIGDTLGTQLSLLHACADVPNVISVSITLPVDSPIPDLFPDYVNIESAQRLMLRVLDISTALTELHPPKGEKGVVSFQVRDWIVSEKHPIEITAEFDNGEVYVSPSARSDAIQCDIAAFSRLFSGGMNVERGRLLGVIEGGSAQADAASDALLFGRAPFRSELEPG